MGYPDNDDTNYEVELCRKMLHYVMEKFDMRPSEARQKLHEFFDDNVLLSAHQINPADASHNNPRRR